MMITKTVWIDARRESILWELHTVLIVDRSDA